MNENLPLDQWLNQPPLPEEIRFNPDGSAYIPIEYIKPKLTYLSPTWCTRKFNHFLHTSPDGRLFCSGSVELVISYSMDIRTERAIFYNLQPAIKNVSRIIVGSSTFDVQKYAGNDNWGQTCLSLCIVAASKELGEFFGKSLNKDRLTVPDEYPVREDNKAQKSIKSALKKLS